MKEDEQVNKKIFVLSLPKCRTPHFCHMSEIQLKQTKKNTKKSFSVR